MRASEEKTTPFRINILSYCVSFCVDFVIWEVPENRYASSVKLKLKSLIIVLQSICLRIHAFSRNQKTFDDH